MGAERHVHVHHRAPLEAPPRGQVTRSGQDEAEEERPERDLVREDAGLQVRGDEDDGGGGEERARGRGRGDVPSQVRGEEEESHGELDERIAG